MKDLKIEKIGKHYFLVVPSFRAKFADENGNFFRPSTIVSKPYKTEKGALNQLKNQI